MKQKFEYFLNAIHYSLFLLETKFQMTVHNFVHMIVHSGFDAFGYEEEYNVRIKDKLDKDKEYKKFVKDKNVGTADFLFGTAYCMYLNYPALVLFAFMLRHYDDAFNLWVIIFALYLFICYIPVHKAIYANDRYKEYFKKFKKKDEKWHRKWKWITIAFCIGGVAVGLVGSLVSAFCILID